MVLVATRPACVDLYMTSPSPAKLRGICNPKSIVSLPSALSESFWPIDKNVMAVRAKAFMRVRTKSQTLSSPPPKTFANLRLRDACAQPPRSVPQHRQSILDRSCRPLRAGLTADLSVLRRYLNFNPMHFTLSPGLTDAWGRAAVGRACKRPMARRLFEPLR